MLASGLIGTPTTFINSDVALDGEPVVGSFTVDGLTFAVTEGSDVELVGVSPDWQQVAGSQEGDGSPVAPMLASGPDGLDAGSAALTLPESVAYEGVDYAVTSIGAYAFYLSGVTAAELPAKVTDVDDRAFRSSDVASVTVADGNPSYSSFDGALYDAAQLSLLLIPEGKQGTVLLPLTAESAAPSVFSHCPLVTQIAVEEGSAAFASENGLLYDASLTTLLRVPAGATDITIRDGCTTIAAGAMEACASLATITAPASVTSISPDVFTSVPTVSLPAASAVADDPGASTEATEGSSEQASSAPASSSATTQLTAMVALSSADDDLPEVDPSVIEVFVVMNGAPEPWAACGFSVELGSPRVEEGDGLSGAPMATLEAAASYSSLATHFCVCWPATPYAIDSSNNVSTYEGTAHGQTHKWISPWTIGPYFRYYQNSIWVKTDLNAAWYTRIGINGSVTGITSVEVGTSIDNLRAISPSASYTMLESAAPAAQGARYAYISINGARSEHTVTWILNDGLGGQQVQKVTYNTNATPVSPQRDGYLFGGWYSDAACTSKVGDASFSPTITEDVAYYAKWLPCNVDVSFDVDSEPIDEDYPGEAKPDKTINVADGEVTIETPKRPGYVFQGWVIPDAETGGKEALDQDLVYQGDDGKWYINAGGLTDIGAYESLVGGDGKIELTARWTSVISVDVPSAVTFYADIVTQGNESREGAASSAFGQNKVASQSEVDLRIVGLESTAVATQGSTLGADSILKKASSATPSSSTQKLFSLYPTDKALTPDDLQDPDAVSQAKPADTVDFALDDLLLEKTFAADSFTIPAGDTLNLGYRLNLAETGTELDYDTLSTLDEGTSASIANISYTFSADLTPFWTYDDDGRKLDVAAIKADAEAIAAGDSATTAKYTAWMNADHRFYVRWFDQGIAESADPTASTVYEVRIIGLNHDDRADGSGKAGLTFQLVNCLDEPRRINASPTNAGGWGSTELYASMASGDLWVQVPQRLAPELVEVSKWCGQSCTVQTASAQQLSCRLFLLSYAELGGSIIGPSTGTNWAPYQWLAQEGPQYAYWKGVGATGDHVAQSCLMKSVSGTVTPWWTRSMRPLDTKAFDGVSAQGNPTTTGINGNANCVYGICPAFCL